MIREENNAYVLETANTTYCFRALDTGHLEHLYYGRKITLDRGGIAALAEKHAFAPGNTVAYDSRHESFSLEDMRLEMSSGGKGDIREPFVEVVHADGSRTSDFLFESAEATRGKEEFETLPGSYDEKGNVDHLAVTLRDKQYGLRLILHYFVYEDCDVVTRSACLYNDGGEAVRVERLMSAQLDFDVPDLSMVTFGGAWAREMRRTDIRLISGKHVNSTLAGTSSSRANPFVILARDGATEDAGECYGCNLIYSGNHYEAAEVSGYGKTRFVSGINPDSFSWVLDPGERLEAPEAVMAYSGEGFNGMSQRMHRFVREHVVRGFWKRRNRPVLLNSWEAVGFDFSERKLVSLARRARDLGIELFVMDDGWFGERDDDKHSLGDWDPNPKKLPDGLAGICRKVKALGLDFGIWVEPEMVSRGSRLHRLHPEWVVEIPEKPHSEGRSQSILDLTQEQVQDYIINKMSQVFSSADISYVKWDMNRVFSDSFSKALPPERQGEFSHRYVLGLYRCMRELTRRFPKILFEGCAAGGNRFDLGILCYFPQIWASDDTDALCRAEIQNGYSYGYPPSVISSHVSACPNHQTLRTSPLESRFAVAAFGVCGYELNLADMRREELAAIKEQVALYKKWRGVLQWGSFYRGRSFSQQAGAAGSVLADLPGNQMEWTCVSEDRSRAVGLLMQKLAVPNTQFQYYRARGLNPDARYRFYNRELKFDVREFGDLVNQVAPVHIRPDSIAHRLVARFVKMDGERELCIACGDVLMYNGVRLKQGFGGTGYSGDVRHFPDFAARLYLMEQERGMAPEPVPEMPQPPRDSRQPGDAGQPKEGTEGTQPSGESWQPSAGTEGTQPPREPWQLGDAGQPKEGASEKEAASEEKPGGEREAGAEAVGGMPSQPGEIGQPVEATEPASEREDKEGPFGGSEAASGSEAEMPESDGGRESEAASPGDAEGQGSDAGEERADG